MKWFSGSINEAVATSKSRKAIFVVFVAGSDEASIEATKVIDTPEISSSLEKDDFVAIKLESGSESYRFFAQIYQLVPVPSLFFIGRNGKPLEIVAGNITTSNLISKIDIVLSKAKENGTSDDLIKAEQSAAVASSSHSSTSNVPTNEASTVKTSQLIENQSAINASQTHTEKIKEDLSSKEASSSLNSETVQVASENNDKKDLTPEEKVERAKKLIELQKQQKLEQEREKEKLQEKERREIGKQMQSARRQQQDLEMKLAHEERKKEKAAELEARERIRHQIAQDKLERKQREQALLQQTMQQQQQQQNNQPRPSGSSVFPNDGNTRIQFRLPSGNPHTATFEATSTLRELRAYVVGNIDLPFQEFSLSMSFPRRDLNQEDDEKTLLELQLVPNAVILILPVRNIKSTSVVAAEDSSFLSRFVWALFAPILTVYNYLSGQLFGTQTRDRNQQNDSNSSDGPSIRTSRVFSSNDMSQSTGVVRRNIGGSSVSVRGLRNVHRLHSGGDDNDENNTWNGNSTQQM
ncbi:UBX domain-containing protein 4-like [Chelonus insularis]|uniref:UBX domain-containing protein 4-like n=1 Tax=Chelonus insularis TaxID=460826 RepID=UPI00158E7E37|nr:UBX domain-containing protein 4-like [Chelonus insularis]XP_034941853.1 UBX domain-containing protein 4-like [Chelonus insularis]